MLTGRLKSQKYISSIIPYLVILSLAHLLVMFIRSLPEVFLIENLSYSWEFLLSSG